VTQEQEGTSQFPIDVDWTEHEEEEEEEEVLEEEEVAVSPLEEEEVAEAPYLARHPGPQGRDYVQIRHEMLYTRQENWPMRNAVEEKSAGNPAHRVNAVFCSYTEGQDRAWHFRVEQE
jgi:hypothetical protein